jgi:non-haem Fe2+, alpha-ketoglutarate-dependent halogenase
LGPNLLCWSAQFFIKNAHDAAFVSWHQDATYWGLSSPEVMTAWVALSPSTVQSGCMRVIPKTHLQQLTHTDTFSERNLLSRGQEIAVNVDLNQALDVVLEPGQMSLHHVLLVHGSEPNGADHRRVGFAIRYIPSHVRQLSPIRDSATLVRGVDEFNYFDHEAAPVCDMHPDAVALHKEVVDRQLKILYTGAKQSGRLGSTVGL